MNTKNKKTTKKTNKPTGYVVWQNKLIAMIILVKSSNKKTGNMIQSYIIRKDINPIEAVNNGKDYLICGNCPHRKNQATGRRTCYVNLGQGVLQVYKQFLLGKYPQFNPKKHSQILKNRMLRLGTYGDPVFVPYRVWKFLLTFVKGRTGYTHQWSSNIDSNFKSIVMASCDSKADVILSNLLGYRSFVVVNHDDKDAKKTDINAILCVNKSHDKQCENCGLCNGNPNSMGKNIFIPAHGTSKRFVKNLL